jgi:hypothetical protein
MVVGQEEGTEVQSRFFLLDQVVVNHTTPLVRSGGKATTAVLELAA